LVVELGHARENERRKIANELHDEVGQNLVLAIMKLNLLKTSVSEEQKPLLEEIHRLITGVIDETRSLVCDLYPHGLRDLGLQSALEWLIQRTRVSYGLCCAADLVSVPRAMPHEIAETAFQTVRELLINVAKHAQASTARVILRGEKHRLLIKVVDDGKGFDPARRSPMHPRGGGFGLLSVRERVSRLDGTMHIDSTPGLGTTITLSLPTHLVKPV
jgi:signal transduction histidine kinase